MAYYHEGYNEAQAWVMSPERTEEERLMFGQNSSATQAGLTSKRARFVAALPYDVSIENDFLDIVCNISIIKEG